MAHVAVVAVGADRPGIVAAVTGVFVEHGCNLDDCSMTILRGHFAMTLVVDVPGDVQPEALEAALVAPAAALDLVYAVRPIDDEVPSSPPGDRWTLSVYGADRPGIVHRVASLLAADDVNILDLATRVIGGADQPVYTMVLDVSLPPGLDAPALERRLDELRTDLDVDCTLHPADADIL